MPAKRIQVYDTSTGQKLDNPVPEAWMKVFPHLAPLPSKTAAARTSPAQVARTRSGSSGRRPRSGSRNSGSNIDSSQPGQSTPKTEDT